MTLNIFLAIATVLNVGFFTSFLIRYTKLKNQIKKHSYSNGIFRQIDEDKQESFLLMAIYMGFNVIILAWAIYEINN